MGLGSFQAQRSRTTDLESGISDGQHCRFGKEFLNAHRFRFSRNRPDFRNLGIRFWPVSATDSYHTFGSTAMNYFIVTNIETGRSWFAKRGEVRIYFLPLVAHKYHIMDLETLETVKELK